MLLSNLLNKKRTVLMISSSSKIKLAEDFKYVYYNEKPSKLFGFISSMFEIFINSFFAFMLKAGSANIVFQGVLSNIHSSKFILLRFEKFWTQKSIYL